MGPQDARSSALTVEEEALCVAFRKHTLLPLDDCLYALQTSLPHLTRSSLHRLLQRHDISRLPSAEGERTRKKFKSYPIGYFHIDMAEMRTAQGKLYMFVAIDRASKFAFVELHEKATRRNATEFLRRLIKAVPYKVHTVLTDNGVQFTTPGNVASAAKDIRQALDRGALVWAHGFELVCAQNDIDHRLTKPNHPWTNGQVERMNRTLKRPPSGATTATATTSYALISRPSSTPTTSPSASRPSTASLPSSTSANAGQNSRTDSSSIQPTSLRDWTPRTGPMI
jgi:IS30 family transposase